MRAVITEPVSRTAEALSAAEFTSALSSFGPFATPMTLGLAISGGPDSMALAFCAHAWAVHHGHHLKAWIVDHALRSESAAEAKATQKELARLGITADILRWDHVPIVSRLHITARKARYRLLIEACKHEGVHHLMLAHQEEDQAETVLMRLAKGSGIDGLAGIAAETHIDGVRLLRPFLKISKERLIATCRAAKISFITDPSNVSDRFARGRLRRVLPLLESEGLTTARLTDLASRAKDASDALTYYTHQLLRVAGTQDDAGVIRFDLEHLRSAPSATAIRALSVCLQTLHAEDYAAEQASLQSLLEALRTDADMSPRTLHGCLMSKNKTSAIFMREFSAIHDALPIQAGDCVNWDARWEVVLENASDTRSYILRALGNPPHDVVDKMAPGLRQKVPQGRARASLPALWHGEELAIIPTFFAPSAVMARLLKTWPPL